MLLDKQPRESCLYGVVGEKKDGMCQPSFRVKAEYASQVVVHSQTVQLHLVDKSRFYG